MLLNRYVILYYSVFYLKINSCFSYLQSVVSCLREIVDKLVNGFFEYDSGKLNFSVSKIEASLPTGELYEGSFVMKSVNETLVKGNIYTSSMRLICRLDYFEEVEKEVKFVFDPTGLEPGDVIKGDVQIVSNAGEYYIPFAFSIVHGVVKSSLGTVRNLFHFTNQAQSNWEEAVQLFYSPEFMQVFEGNDRIHLDKYRGLSNLDMSEQCVDEFLVAVHKKQPVFYSVERSTYEFNDVTDELRCEVSLHKSTWGYVYLQLEADNEFLRLEKESLTDDDFLGNEHKLVFYIDEEKLHEGKNFGRILLHNDRQTLSVTIVAQRRKRNEAARFERREKSKRTCRLMRQYVAFRTKQIGVSTWVRESMKIVERMNSLDEKNPVSRLFQAQLLLVEERYNEAKWILEHVEKEMNIKQTSAECYCYYLYLTTLYRRDESYVNQTTDMVAEIFGRNKKSFRILWALLYLDEELSQNSSQKIAMIERQFEGGCFSPVLYIEAYNYFTANPATLNKLTDFELQVLLFAVKNGKLDSDVRKQLIYLAGRQKNYSETLLKILMMTYKIVPDEELVEVICTLLIKAGKTDVKYFKWYARGVECELRITKLYEYYMFSIPMSYKELLPKEVLMYFGFHNELHFSRLAFLYANLVNHKREVPELYEAYRENMLVFAIEQIEQEHIDANLAIVYGDVLFVEMIKPDMANHLAKLLFTYEVTVKDDKAKSIVVLQEQFHGEQRYPVENLTAYPRIYSGECTILSEDEQGRRTLVDDSDVRKLMNEAVFIPAIKHYVNHNLFFSLYLCEGKRHYVVVEDENIDLCRELVEAEEGREYFKRDIRMGLLHYYYDNDQITTLDEFLVNMDTKVLCAKDRAEVINFFVRRGMYENAYELITIYGAEEVSAKTCVKICSQMIDKKEQIPDAMLVKVSYYAFKLNKYDSLTLKYLVDNFNGLTKELRDLWKAARQFDIECFSLIEKLIIQMLYTRTTVGEKEEIFENYLKRGASTNVELAYLSYNAFDYFAKERMMDSRIFEYLVNNYRIGEKLNDACRLALLKYYAEEEKNRSERIKDMLIIFLKDFLHRNIYFKFFNEYVDMVPELSAFSDKAIIEYRTNPSSRVVLHYILEGQDSSEDVYHTEEMRNMFGGVFSKEFILFFGENLQYYITEERGGSEQLTISDSVSISDAVAEGNESRYSLLNDMVVSKTLQDDDTLMKLMEEYVEADYFTEQIFTLI